MSRLKLKEKNIRKFYIARTANNLTLLYNTRIRVQLVKKFSYFLLFLVLSVGLLQKILTRPEAKSSSSRYYLINIIDLYFHTLKGKKLKIRELHTNFKRIQVLCKKSL